MTAITPSAEIREIVSTQYADARQRVSVLHADLVALADEIDLLRNRDAAWMVDDTFPQKVADEAHRSAGPGSRGHTFGRCLACHSIYAAVMSVLRTVDSGSQGTGA